MDKYILFTNLRGQKVERMKPLYLARKMGLRVVLIDKNPSKDIKDLFDDVIIADSVNISDTIEKVSKFFFSKKIVGVLTWRDGEVELVAKIGEMFNLPTVSVNSSRKARNKYLMREAINKIPGLCPAYKRITSFIDFIQASKEIGFPAIFKPVGASGSKAIFKIDEASNLEEIYSTMVESTKPEKDKMFKFYPFEYIYEEFIDGDEVSVDGVIQDNKIYIAGITDKEVTADFSFEYSCLFPSEKNEDEKKKIIEGSKQALKLLELNNCPFHLEGRITKNGFKIIEVAARPGGGFITSDLIERAVGIPFHENVLRVAVGLPVIWEPREATKHFGTWDVYPSQTGVIKNISGIYDAMEIEGMIYALPGVEIGDKVGLPPEDFSTILCTMVAEAENNSELAKNFCIAQSKLVFEVE